jgi:hypothetical protein
VLRAQGESHATSIGFNWGGCRSLTGLALDDLDPEFWHHTGETLWNEHERLRFPPNCSPTRRLNQPPSAFKSIEPVAQLKPATAFIRQSQKPLSKSRFALTTSC